MDERSYQAGPSSGHVRRLLDTNGRDLSGFREEKGTMRRLISVEREMRNMRELISGILLKQDELVEENKDLRNKFIECERDLQMNK